MKKKNLKEIASEDMFFNENEFIDFITEKQQNNTEEMMEAYKTFFGTNNNPNEVKGISKQELKVTMEKYGEKHTSDEFDKLFQEND